MSSYLTRGTQCFATCQIALLAFDIRVDELKLDFFYLQLCSLLCFPFYSLWPHIN
jgi:hypothetical protein